MYSNTKRLLFTQTLIFFLKLEGECPRLRDVAKVVQEELKSASNARIRNVVEGLLAHFFSSHRPNYPAEDILFFLEVANLQTQWQATFLMNEVIDVCPSTDHQLNVHDFSLSFSHLG